MAWTLRPLQTSCDLTGKPQRRGIPACRRPAVWVLWDPKAMIDGSVLFLCDYHKKRGEKAPPRRRGPRAPAEKS
jgi:hypothetical protein